MPTYYSGMSDTDLLNAIRNELQSDGNSAYAAAIQPATEENYREVFNEIVKTPRWRNAFLGMLYNCFPIAVFTNSKYKNHMAPLWKGDLRYGAGVEEIFVDGIARRAYNPADSENEALKRYIPRILSKIHSSMAQLKYPFTIQRHDLEMAASSEQPVNYLIQQIVSRASDLSERDDEVNTVNLLVGGYKNGFMTPIHISEPSADNIKSIVSTVRATITRMGYMRTDYNYCGVETSTPKDKLVVVMDADFDAKYGVELLSAAFNTAYADIPVETVVLDDFYGETGIKLMLLDKDYAQIYDKLKEYASNFIADGLYTNNYLHRWAIYSLSPFCNAVAFTTDEISAPTAVALTPELNAYKPGSAMYIDVAFTGSGVYSRQLKWALSGNTDAASVVSGGVFYAGPAEHGDCVITATATAGTNVSASVTIKSVDAPETVTVTFNKNGHGNETPAQTIIKGGKAVKPQSPTAVGFVFEGWVTTASGSTEFDFSSAINSNTTVYAKWSVLS